MSAGWTRRLAPVDRLTRLVDQEHRPVLLDADELLRTLDADEVDQRAQEDRDRNPVVEAHAEEDVRVVGAHRLDPEAPGRVTHHVKREGPALAQLELAVDKPDHDRDADVPDRLVEERRME